MVGQSLSRQRREVCSGETSSSKTLRRWGIQTGKRQVPKRAKNAPNPCKPVKDSVRLKQASLSRKGKGRCLDRNDLVANVPMSGQASSNGRCGQSKSCMRRSDHSSCFMKPQGSEPKKSMSLSVRWPAKLMSLNGTGCKACSPLESRGEQEKRARRSHQRSASSLSIFTRRCPPC